MLFSPGKPRLFTRRDGMPDTEIFSIRETRDGDLLMGTRAGMVRMHGSTLPSRNRPTAAALCLGCAGRFRGPRVDGHTWRFGGADRARDPHCGRRRTAERQRRGHAAPGPRRRIVGWKLWQGLWRIQGDDVRLLGMADGLSSENIREIYQDSQGILWIGTFGGGLDARRDGKFYRFMQKDGLLSDNIANIVDDGESLWLSTTRGICRIPKQQLWNSPRAKDRLQPINYGMDDGLRSAQCSPGYPRAAGTGRRTDACGSLPAAGWRSSTRMRAGPPPCPPSYRFRK